MPDGADNTKLQLDFIAECTGACESTCAVLLTASGGNVDDAVSLHFEAAEACQEPVVKLEVIDCVEKHACGIYVGTAEVLYDHPIWEREGGGFMIFRGPGREWLIDTAANKHWAICGKASGLAKSAPAESLPHFATWQGATVSSCGHAAKVDRQACRAIAPAVHLWWLPDPYVLLPPRIAWFYNEVTVQKSFPATYFMACGWKNGYFGIQDHGPAKGGYVIFSVWDHVSSMSPQFGNQNPDLVSEDDRTEILGHGAGVTAKRFGGEGTGGQSFIPHNWRLGQTCRLLVRCEEVAGGPTPKAIFSGFFHIPEEGIWRLLASFRVRVPAMQGASLLGPYSFIEDWADNGQRRSGLWGPAWVRGPDAAASWQQLNTVTVTTTHNNANRSRSCSLVENRVGMISGGELLPTSTMGPFHVPVSELPAILRDFPLPEHDEALAPKEEDAMLKALPLPNEGSPVDGDAVSLEDTTILAASRWRVDYANGFSNTFNFSEDASRVEVETRDPGGGAGVADVVQIEVASIQDGFAYRLQGHYAPGKYELFKFAGGRLLLRHWSGAEFMDATGSRLSKI